MVTNEADKNRRFGPEFSRDDEEDDSQIIKDLLAVGGVRDSRGNILIGGYIAYGPDLGGVNPKPAANIDTKVKLGYESAEDVAKRKGEEVA